MKVHEPKRERLLDRQVSAAGSRRQAYMDVFTASCRAGDRSLLNTWYFHLTGRMHGFHERLGEAFGEALLLAMILLMRNIHRLRETPQDPDALRGAESTHADLAALTLRDAPRHRA